MLLDYKNMYLFGQGIDDPSSIRIACGAHNMLLKEPSPLDRSISISEEGQWRGGRPATTISSPSHILLIFSSELPRNPRPSIIMCLKVSNSLR